MLSERPIELLRFWLQRQLPAEAWSWLSETMDNFAANGTDRALYMAVSLVPRKIGKADLNFSANDAEQAEASRPGWTMLGASVDQAARLALMLSATTDGEEFARRLEQLRITADVGELVAIYRGLPIYPDQRRYVAFAGEGLRTNMKSVFEAVAHRNPYPAENLAQDAWNQMVLKAVFVGSALDPIIGLDERRNPQLAQTLVDYAHERWAASRSITPELWRMIGPYADEAMIEDLRRPLTSDALVERQAAALALSECSDDKAVRLLDTIKDISTEIVAGRLSWGTISRDAP